MQMAHNAGDQAGPPAGRAAATVISKGSEHRGAWLKGLLSSEEKPVSHLHQETIQHSAAGMEKQCAASLKQAEAPPTTPEQ